MSHLIRSISLFLMFVLLFTSSVPATVHASESTAVAACEDGTQDSGARYRICMPTLVPWNGILLVYAHPYVAPNDELAVQDEINGTSISTSFNFLGYAYATTSYSTNGLAVLEGVDDVVDLVSIFRTQQEAPDKIYLLGASEGGLVATLAAEQNPDLFDGTAAICGPVGDFQAQVDYIGDFRVIFDYFFPDLLEGSPIEIPQSLIDSWDSHYETVIQPAITDASNSHLVDQLFAVTGVSFDANDPNSQQDAIQNLLWYNIVGTNDTVDKLGGHAYDNQNRQYSGSDDDTLLNESVQRFSADQAALDEVASNYQTTGDLQIPLVNLHTLHDPIVPYQQATLYADKVNNTENFQHQAVDSHGHCTFSPTDLASAFAQLDAMQTRYAFLPLVVR